MSKEDRIKQEADEARKLLEAAGQNADGQAPEGEPQADVEELNTDTKNAPVKLNLSFDENSEADPNDEKIKSLEAELQKHRVEEGRLKKLSKEFDEMKRQNEELQSKLREIEDMRGEDRVLDFIPEDRRQMVDEESMRAAANIVDGRLKEYGSTVNAEIQALKEELQGAKTLLRQQSLGNVDAEIERAYPGFLAATQQGGKLYDAWKTFVSKTDVATGRTYLESVSSAYGEGRLPGVSRVIQDFMSDAGISRNNAVGAPSASANAVGSGNFGGDNKVYRSSEVNQLLEKSGRDFAEGKITGSQRKALIETIQTAIMEGRVRPG